PCAAAERRELFNGKDLSGWQMIRTEGQDTFAVENGVMHTTGHKGDALYAAEKIGNATLHIVYKMSNDHGNSGVFIRIPAITQNEGDLINKGIEVKIDNRDNDYHCTGVLYSMTKAKARPYKPAGEWNTMDITLDGPRTIVKVNGVLVTDYDGKSPVPPKKLPYEPDRGPRPDEGYIAVQAHDPSAVITFKEISVEPLGK
ncbi:MAG TPA: DUF1080 domain-containing protein, partial [Bryobacteraceae bacterium]|nr:DUF1080 domain-containing protein [Bryobacteraceae bacterium]